MAKTKPAAPTARIQSLTLDELKGMWPKSEDGRMCARLLQRYCYALLVKSSAGAACTAERAQAEAGANKAVAKITDDFSELGFEAAPQEKPNGIRQLHRFATTTPEQPERKK